MVMRRLFFTAIALATYIDGSASGAYSQTQNSHQVQTQSARQAPTIEALINSMVNYHPYVLAINEGNYQAAAELEIARSSFDPFIEQKTKSRVSGYYDIVVTRYPAFRFLFNEGVETASCYLKLSCRLIVSFVNCQHVRVIIHHAINQRFNGWRLSSALSLHLVTILRLRICARCTPIYISS